MRGFLLVPARIVLSGLVIGVLLAGAAPPAIGQEGIDRVREELRRTDEGLARAAEVVRESDSQRARELLAHARTVQANAWAQFHERRPAIAARLTREARSLAARALTLAKEDTSLRNRAERELEKAQRTQARAREEIGDAPSEQVVRLLQEAQDQIQRGRRQFGEQNYVATIRLAVSAQRLVHRALGLGVGGGDRRIQRELERTDRLIERAQPIVRESENEEAKRILERAITLQQNSWTALRDGRPRQALATTREARNLVQRALVMARGPVDVDRVRQAIEEIDDLLERAREIVRESGNERALQMLEKATEHQVRAKRLLDDGELRQALAETRVARRLAMRGIRFAEEGSGA